METSRRGAAKFERTALFLHFNRRWERGRNERGRRQRKGGGEERKRERGREGEAS